MGMQKQSGNTCATLINGFSFLDSDKEIKSRINFHQKYVMTNYEGFCCVSFKFIIIFIIIIIIIIIQIFPTSISWSLSDSKSPQVSKTILNIVDNLSKAVVEIVLICPPISTSSSLLFKCTNYILVSPLPFLSSEQNPSTCLSFCFL